MLVRKHLLSYLFLFLYVVGFSQDDFFVNYTIKDGLPSNQIYSCLQDQEGYMWFGSENGVIRFDGTEFKTFTSKDGLVSQQVFLLTKDTKHRIWCHTQSDGLNYIRANKIYTLSKEAKLNEFTQITEFNDAVYIVDSKQNKFVVNGDSLIYESNLKERSKKFKTKYGKPFGLVLIDDGEYIYISNDKILKVSNDQLIEPLLNLEVFSSKGINFYHSLDHHRFYDGTNFVGSSLNSESLVAVNVKNTLKHIYIDLKDVFGEKPASVRANSVDGGIMITTNLGFLILNDKLELEDKLVFGDYLKSKNIARGFVDRDKNIWLVSTTDGIFFLNHQLIDLEWVNKPSKSVPITSLDKPKNREGFYFGDVAGNLMEYDGGKPKLLHKLNYEAANNSIRFIKYLEQQKRLFFSNNKLKSLRKNSIGEIAQNEIITSESILKKIKRVANTFPNQSFSIQNVFELPKLDGHAIKNKNRTILLLGESNHKAFFVNDYDVRLSEVVEGFDNDYLFICNEGVYRLEDKAFEKIEISTTVNTACKLNDNLIILGTNNEGLYSLNKQFKPKLIYESGRINDILKLSDSLFFFNTHLEIFKVKLQKDGTFKVSQFFNSGRFKLDFEMNLLTSYKDTLFVGTNKGLLKVPTNFKSSNRAFKIKLEEISANDNQISLSDRINLNHKENNIGIKLKAINYHGADPMTYCYTINEDSNLMYTSDSRVIGLEQLAPGNYHLAFHALDQDLVESSNKIEIDIKIKKPWWQSWWFRLLLFFVLCSLLYYFFKRQVAKVKEREKNKAQIENNIATTKLEALQSQMNPHFIFNALNSIHSLIQFDEVEKADHYLQVFGSIVRKFLDSSKELSTSLKVELELTKEYLELEKLRFGDRLSYTIVNEIGDEIETINVPSFLLQPLVENSIKHGLFNKQGNGTVALNISKKGEDVLIGIKDDGIGLIESQKFKQKKPSLHRSKGLNLVRQKMEIFEKLNLGKIRFEMKDLKAQGELGTLVNIHILK